MRMVNFASAEEAFRPWVIERKGSFTSKVSYFVRMIIDTPTRSLNSFLKPRLAAFKGKTLDVGAGSQFYRQYLPEGTSYRALELQPKSGDLYGWENEAKDIDFYTGREMPYADRSFKNVICLEVLEHCEDPKLLISEIARVLEPGGECVLSVPFAAKWHYIPNDYRRYTPSGLEQLFNQVPQLKLKLMVRRGTDFTVAFHTLTSAMVALVFSKNPINKVLGVFGLPLTFCFGVMANLTEWFDFGAPENTLGYVCLLEKPRDLES